MSAALLTLALAPLVLAAASIIGRHWYPSSDVAIQLLQIDDVGGPHTPLTGAHSRYGWDHPGPLLFWLLAPFDWVFGTTGVLVGVAVLNSAAIAGALVVARRIGGLPLAALVTVTVLMLTLANHTDLLVDVWNPWVAVLPFFTYLLLAWALAGGDLTVLPWMVGAGTFVVQAHVGYAPLVLGSGLAAAVMASLWRPPTGDRSGVRGPGIAALVVGAVLWLPPILQQLFGDRGNLRAIIAYFRDPTEPAAGWSIAWGILGRELGPPGAWLAGGEFGAFGVRAAPTGPALVLVAVMVAFGVAAARRGAHSAGRLTGLLLVMVAVGVVATSRITGLIGTYLVRWWWVIAALIWLSIAWSVTCLLAERRTRTAVLAAGIIAALALSTLTAIRAVPVRFRDAADSVAIEALGRQLAPRLDPQADYLVDWTDADRWGAVGVGLFAHLDRLGLPVFAPEWRAPTVGAWRTARPEDVDAALLVVGSNDEEAGFRLPFGAEVIARSDPASDAAVSYTVYLHSPVSG